VWIDGLIGGLIEAPTCQHANMPTSFWNLVPVPNSAWTHIQTHPNLNVQRRHAEYRNDKKWLIWHPRLLMISMVLIECQAQSCWNTEACNLLWALRRQRHRRRWTSQNSRAAEERPKMTKRSNKALVNIHVYIYLCIYVCIYIYVYIYVVKPSHLGKWLHNGGTAERFSWEKLHQAQPTLYLW